MAWPNATRGAVRWARWPGEPERCTCVIRVADDLADTLACPKRWRWVAAIRKWVHQL